ncbi:MAG: acetate kinase [Cellulomonadaceae bacterium]|nr:acetate kinase [Cellulomonadaceae bacterium]
MSTVFVLNSGSSSLKYQLVDPETGSVSAVGLVDRIGLAEGKIVHEVGGQKFEVTTPIPDHGVALEKVLELFKEHGPKLEDAGIVAVGHRVVHGGTKFSAPVVLDDNSIKGIKDLIPLAPLHNPANVTGIEAARKLFDVPQVAVFDTAFFSTLPAEAYTYAIDKDIADKYQIRRYGFHGTSHHYVSQKVAEVLGRDDLKIVVLHLGNGASASAVVNGKAVDTSMGLTPLEGLVMGTRSGDIDPAVVFHLQREAGMSTNDIDNLLNKKSGMLGLCGASDMREVEAAAAAGEPAAVVAQNVYVHRLAKYVGAYAAIMNGIDVLVFTAGVGENDARMRELLADRTSFLGLHVDPAKNSVRSKEPRIISPDADIKAFEAGNGPIVMVVPTNEELAIAQQAAAAIQK